MKFAGILCFLLLTSFLTGNRSKGVDPKTLTFEQVEAYIQNVNLQKSKKKLTRYAHDGMTAWGSLVAYWGKSDLLIAESVYNAEAGFSTLDVYFNEGEICRIISKKHMANWAQYERDHGNEEYDQSKLTYTDIQYDYTFGKETTFRILKDGKMVPSEINQTALDADLFSAREMQKFLQETDM